MNNRGGAPLLRCEGLCKSFGPPARRIDVLRGLDLVVQRGEMVAILGESGTGKTTLMHLGGAIDRPDAGIIRFRDKNIADASSADRASYRNRDLGFLFQSHNLLPEFSAVENVMMPLLIRGEDRRAGLERARALLSELGLSAHLDRRPGATQQHSGDNEIVAA